MQENRGGLDRSILCIGIAETADHRRRSGLTYGDLRHQKVKLHCNRVVTQER
jgi:hypothetical protein